MAKALAIFGMVVALLILLVFGLDAAIGVPFGKANTLMSIAFAFCGAVLAYMSWDAFRSA
ncbi:hypothetical protein [Botrimarina hoheduenensis]|uniref:Uncharacterized protein n=1 Tax=Botrimarina hoheduenensis TaxID=2528000 RepID=A0A5C5VSF2_9BACT|nr:hypothetical protein [Botrimarina hoheduenensis]TWT41554.1 hypothetical protein Pla111_29310 [Botrimarina hoheduenensis]